MSEQENRDSLERYRQEFFERQDVDPRSRGLGRTSQSLSKRPIGERRG